MKIIIPLFKENQKLPKQFTKLLYGKPAIEYLINTLSSLNIGHFDFEIWTNIEEIRDKYNGLKTEYKTYDQAKNLNNKTLIFINPNFVFISEFTISECIKNPENSLVSGESFVFGDKLSKIDKSPTFIDQSNQVIKLSSKEQINLGTRYGWWIAEKELRKKKIIVHPLSAKKLGTGHIYRGLTLATRLFVDHDVIFLFRSDQQLGINMVSIEGFQVLTYSENENPEEEIIQNQPDIVINDLLDTSKDYIVKLKQCGIRVINFEDMGEGAAYADAVINALYPGDVPHDNFYTGEDYYCIREDFIGAPKKVVTKDVKEILITYGGEDPQFLTLTTLKGILKLQEDYHFHVKIILGPAFNKHDELHNTIEELGLNKKVTIYDSVKHMSSFMREADIIFTSAGRTMYEVATIGTPAVITAQNYRELTHTFGHPYNGFYNLGYWAEASENSYYEVTKELILNYDLRKLMHDRMSKSDFSQGINRVLRIILNEEGE